MGSMVAYHIIAMLSWWHAHDITWSTPLFSAIQKNVVLVTSCIFTLGAGGVLWGLKPESSAFHLPPGDLFTCCCRRYIPCTEKCHPSKAWFFQRGHLYVQHLYYIFRGILIAECKYWWETLFVKRCRDYRMLFASDFHTRPMFLFQQSTTKPNPLEIFSHPESSERF